MTRFKASTLAATLLFSLSASCVPDLQPAHLCAPDVIVAYEDAPDGLIAPVTAEVAGDYAALTGKWQAELQCPVGADSGSITVEFRTPNLDQMKVVAGADLNQVGTDCERTGMILTDGEMIWNGPALGLM